MNKITSKRELEIWKYGTDSSQRGGGGDKDGKKGEELVKEHV